MWELKEVSFTDINNQLYESTIQSVDPVYTSVKVHTVHSELCNTALTKALSKFGTIVSIKDEQFIQSHFYTCRSEKRRENQTDKTHPKLHNSKRS